MSKTMRSVFRLLLLCALLLLIASPLPAKADGGPIVPYDLWAHLTEGQQIAVVTLLSQESARIDLFISILDKTGEPHEVTFFVPLGAEAADFYAVEQDLIEFDREKTGSLDAILRGSASRRRFALHTLFSGTLLTNGVLLVPLWAPMLLSGCAATAPQPEATFQTESSQISIYGLDEDTDLEALINTTGLPPSVQTTLSGLRGQRIAVVNLKTQPQGGGSPGPYGQPSEPGLHLSWTASLIPGDAGPSYSYPLGTGKSWSKPIELTRVYVVAPAGTDFEVEYPALGSEQSGYGLRSRARIADYYQIPAYSVDEARGSFGRVWRVTYTMSNPTQDITIVARPQGALSRLRAVMEESSLAIALAFAFIVGLACWILAWYFLMPRLTGQNPRSESRLRWYWSLIYPGLNAALLIFPGVILYVFFLIGLAIPALALLFLLLGGASIGLFELVHAGRIGVSRSRALGAFVLVSLAGNGAYLVLALIYAKLSGII